MALCEYRRATPEHAIPHPSRAKRHPTTGLTRKPPTTGNEPRKSGRENEQILHCVQIPHPPVQGQNDVSFRGFGTLFSKYEQKNAVNIQ